MEGKIARGFKESQLTPAEHRGPEYEVETRPQDHLVYYCGL
jgi:hypothetical protein